MKIGKIHYPKEKKKPKFEEIESFLDGKKSQKWDDWEVMKDSSKALHWKPVLNKRGNIHHREEKVETCFRLVVIKNEKKRQRILVLTNEFELSAKEIADYYRKRWDIEVFLDS